MPFQIIRENITKAKADAIVNTANPEPVYGPGVDQAIYTAAGEQEMMEERRKIGRMETGSVFVTPGFALDAKYVIHTVAPVYEEEERNRCLKELSACYTACLFEAEKLRLSSIAFPLIGSGSNGFPRSEALKTAITACSDFLLSHEMKILLAVFDQKSYELSRKVFDGVDSYLEEHLVDYTLREEYGNLPSISSGRRRRRPKNFFHARESLADEDMEACAADRERSLEDVIRNIQETFQESLLHWIDRKGYTDTEVYKRAGIDRRLFSKIRSNNSYHPGKTTAVSLCLALNLGLDDTKDLLARAGYALSPSSKWDMIVEYFIRNGVYDSYTINLALLEHGQKILLGS
ncbi:MAG: macro domain-containing protein [Solobacterium sp.]|nr:macro domain-containing protein [Solobacterium sp.]